MIKAGLMDAKCDQMVTYVELDKFHACEHDVARNAERYCTRQVGLDHLMNSCHGGAGRIPNDTSVGGIFLLVGVNQRMSTNLSRGLVALGADLLRPSARLHERRSIQNPMY